MSSKRSGNFQSRILQIPRDGGVQGASRREHGKHHLVRRHQKNAIPPPGGHTALKHMYRISVGDRRHFRPTASEEREHGRSYETKVPVPARETSLWRFGRGATADLPIARGRGSYRSGRRTNRAWNALGVNIPENTIPLLALPSH